MQGFNKRLFFWLVKAYIKKWGRVLVLSFVGGLMGFFLIAFVSRNLVHLFPQKERIGMIGAYRLDNLPTSITAKLSRGLTKVTSSGQIQPDLASSWQIKDGGKTYIFHLKHGIFFDNGQEVTSQNLGYSFQDVKIDTPD
ncbi:MAG TPA: ABC transporter substrate-binding protein, partial [Patescibacteria group bacterium]|nr:ABC transporter substrate-binding protein [Patescibacteria group bacterium]